MVTKEQLIKLSRDFFGGELPADSKTFSLETVLELVAYFKREGAITFTFELVVDGPWSEKGEHGIASGSTLVDGDCFVEARTYVKINSSLPPSTSSGCLEIVFDDNVNLGWSEPLNEREVGYPGENTLTEILDMVLNYEKQAKEARDEMERL